VSRCLSYGYRTLKLFPASDLPLHYIKSLKGPFPQAEFVAVGGISPENTAEYLNAGYGGVGIGSSLTDKTLFARKDWGQITEDIRRYLGGKNCWTPFGDTSLALRPGTMNPLRGYLYGHSAKNDERRTL